VGATAYSLRIIQKIFYGPGLIPLEKDQHSLHDLSIREKLILVPMVMAIIWLGVYPQTVLKTSERPLIEVLQKTHSQVGLHSINKDQPLTSIAGGSHE
jgi:NADH-quinone oxidoreductase subunit M